MNLTTDVLQKVFPNNKNIGEFVNILNDYLDKYEINTLPRVQQFLAQVGHECGGFTVFIENLNYSKDGLLKTFPKYFTQLNVNQYTKQPEKIANKVYANRLGNGDETSGDGWKYRGRGAIQCTGKSNYTKMSGWLNYDCVTYPDVLAEKLYAIESACAWWKNNNLNPKADINTLSGFTQITKIINGGTNGLEDRKAIWERTKKYINLDCIKKKVKIDNTEEKPESIVVEEKQEDSIINDQFVVSDNNSNKDISIETKNKTFLEKLLDFIMFWKK